MRKVLLITNAFPPQAGNQAIHMGKRAKFLMRNGWQTIVLAPEIPAVEKKDPRLMQALNNVEVHRTPYLFLKQQPMLRQSRGLFLTGHKKTPLDRIYLPNGYVRWLPYAIQAGRKMAQKVDVLLSVSNPTITHLIGYTLHRLTGKPWVCELRDPISGYQFNRRGPESFNRLVEGLVAQRATQVFQWGDYVVNPLANKYSGLDPKKFSVIPYGGFDPDDYPHPIPAPPHGSGPLIISHTGSFQAGIASPEHLLKALGKLVQENKIKPGEIRLNFAGDWRDSDQALAGKQKITESIAAHGYIDHGACIELWIASHVLLIVWARLDSEDRFPSKFWEYVGADRFIFALAPPEGKMARMIQEENLGIVAPPDDTESIAAALLEIVARHREGTLRPQRSAGFLARMDRSIGEGQVAAILARAAGEVHEY